MLYEYINSEANARYSFNFYKKKIIHLIPTSANNCTDYTNQNKDSIVKC